MKDTKILIAGKDPVETTELQARLRGFNFTADDIVTTTRECIAAVRGGAIDLVIMNTGTDDYGGIFETADELRDVHDIPVIIIATLQSLRHMRRSDGMDAFDFMFNPVSDLDLYASVTNCLTKHSLGKKLAESERRYRELVDIMGIVILRVDHRGVILFSNKYSEELFGYPHGGLNGRNIAGIIMPPAGRGGAAQDRARGNAWQWDPFFEGMVETECISAGGASAFILWNVSRLRERPDGYRETMYIGYDITQRKRTEYDLIKVKERLEKIYNLSPSYILIVRLKDGVLVEVNDTCLGELNLSREDIVGRIAKLPFAAGDRRSFLKPLMENGFVHDYQNIYRKDGAMRQSSINATIIEIDGEPCILSVINDTTERKTLQDELEKQRKILYDIIDFLPDPTFVIDNMGTVIIWNRAMEKMTGVKKKNMIGKSDHNYAIPFYGEKRPMLVDLVLGQDMLWRHDYGQYDRDGSTITAETRKRKGSGVLSRSIIYGKAAPLFDSSGGIIGSIEIVRDISDIKAAEENIRRSELRYRTIFESTGIAMAMIAKNGNIRLVNNRFRELAEYDEPAASVLNMRNLISGDDHAHLARMLANRETPEDREQPMELHTGTGNVRHVLIHGAAVPGSSEMLISLVDITDKKALEKEVLEAENLAQVKIGQILHDELGQILTGTGFLCESLIKTLSQSPDTQRKAKEIYDLINRARDVTHLVVHGLIPFTLSSGGLPEALFYLAEQTTNLYGISCIVRYDETMKINDSLVETQLYYIAHQSVTNAIKHGLAKRILIFLGKKRGRLSLFIDDDGIGFSGQVANTSGLGIRIMRYRAQSVNCRLTIGPRVPRGTRVACVQ